MSSRRTSPGLPLLLALLLLPGMASPIPLRGQDAPGEAVQDLRLQLAESRELNAQLREENAQLRRQAREQEKELADLRREYATLLLETDRLAGQLARQDLAAAHLVREAESDSPGEPDALLMLAAMGECRRLLQDLQKAWERQQEAMDAALEATQASKALRLPLERQREELRNGWEETLKALGLATLPRLQASAGSAAVLQIDQATQLVLLDQGSLHGLREGQVLLFQREGQSLARLKIALVRPLRAVAFPLEGKLDQLAPGTLLRRETP
ncbi:MAG: hypothetical protein ACI4SG_05095 [Oligosphaeraceae bacterium]